LKKQIILVFLIVTVPLSLRGQSSTADEYAVFIAGMEDPSDNALKVDIANEIISSTHIEIIASDSIGIRQILRSEDIEDAMKEFDPDGLTCPGIDCVEEVVKNLSITRLILIELDRMKFSGNEKNRLKVSGTLDMSLVNVEIVAGTDVVIMITENSTETKIRGNFKELITAIKVNTWTLFGSELPKERFSEEEVTVSEETFSQKMAPYTTDRRFMLTVAVAAGLVIGGGIFLMASSNDVTHTYPPDFPEIP
jgi:hypothetical protein